MKYPQCDVQKLFLLIKNKYKCLFFMLFFKGQINYGFVYHYI